MAPWPSVVTACVPALQAHPEPRTVHPRGRFLTGVPAGPPTSRGKRPRDPETDEVRDPEKEPQRRHGRIERTRVDPTLGHMQLKASDVLEARLVRGPAEKGCQVLDRAD